MVHVLGLSGDGQAGRLREEREVGRAPHPPGPGDGRQESTLLTSDYTTKLQSSRQYGTGTKTKTQLDGTG